MLKAVTVTRPPTQNVSTWDVGVLMNHLQVYDIDDKGLFQVSRHIAALLLLASGRRIHDLTLLDIGPNHMEKHSDRIIFWPKSGSKTDSSTYRQSGWELSFHEVKRLDFSFWMNKIINLSSSRRCCDKKKLIPPLVASLQAGFELCFEMQT